MNLRVFVVAFLSFVGFGFQSSRGARVPLNDEELKKSATHIIQGTVEEVVSQDQESAIERGPGIHTDRVFQIKIRITKVSKGDGLKVGETVTVEAWRPIRRLPPLPGPQGHDFIPKKGGGVTVYAIKNDKKFSAIMPNGIRKNE